MPRLLIAAMVFLSASEAQAQYPCDRLWAERNAIFARAGYCFKTPKAIRAFGNAGCSYDEIEDVPLSARDRKLVDEIQREEILNGCSR